MMISPSWWRGGGERIFSFPFTNWCLFHMHKVIAGLVPSLNQWSWLPLDEEGGGYARVFPGKPVSWPWRRVIIRWYTTTLAPPLAHPSFRRSIFPPLRWYPYRASHMQHYSFFPPKYKIPMIFWFIVPPYQLIYSHNKGPLHLTHSAHMVIPSIHLFCLSIYIEIYCRIAVLIDWITSDRGDTCIINICLHSAIPCGGACCGLIALPGAIIWTGYLLWVSTITFSVPFAAWWSDCCDLGRRISVLPVGIFLPVRYQTPTAPEIYMSTMD